MFSVFVLRISKGCVFFAAFFVFVLVSACKNEDNEISSPAKQTTVIKGKAEPIQTVSVDDEGVSTSAAVDEGETEKQAKVFLSINPNEGVEQDQFSCEDRIYLAIRFKNQEPNLEQIIVTWTDPNGTEREKNDFQFYVSERESLAWASLTLHRSVGAGLLQWVNPAAGMEEFIGTWTVKVNVGEIVNQTKTFDVLC